MTTITPPPPDTAPPARRRRMLFVVAAMTLGLLPLLLLELGLQLSDAGGEAAFQDPLVGFSRVAPLFELDEKAGVYRTARSRRVLFGLQEFAAEKPADGFRIFCLGGSTVRGRPYTTQTAFPRWLALELTARNQQHSFEVINCGGVSYASYRLTNILEEVLHYKPDLVVIATGHNEFLEDRTYGELKGRSSLRAWLEDHLHELRTVQFARQLARSDAGARDERTVLPELVEARLDQTSGYASYHRDTAWSQSVQTHFEQSLRTMAAMCESADVPALLVLLGSNVRDCPPFKSEHRTGISPEDELQWQAHFESAQEWEPTDPERALAAYQQAAELDDEYALLRFRMGRLLDQLGRSTESAPHFLAAKDEDVCPLRMLESFADVILQVADETQIPLVDARELVAERSDARLSGNDWYMDHVHPSIGAHQLIAAAITMHLPLSMDDWPVESRRQTYGRHLESLGPVYLTNGNERVSWLENWARRQRLLDETLPRDPAAHVRFGHRLWDFARQDDAWDHYRAAMHSSPVAVQTLLERCDRLHSEGRSPEALQLLERMAASELAPAADVLEPYWARFTGEH